ncbi:Ig-like domain-containing protein, partial [Mesorhizobium sp. B283B1A]|nr:Ig-like domain-containing protein [Mesorhizobium sp. B283B1A]
MTDGLLYSGTDQTAIGTVPNQTALSGNTFTGYDSYDGGNGAVQLGKAGTTPDADTLQLWLSAAQLSDAGITAEIAYFKNVWLPAHISAQTGQADSSVYIFKTLDLKVTGVEKVVVLDSAGKVPVAVNIVDSALSDSDNSSVVTFTFTGPVTGFTAADVATSHGTLTDFVMVDASHYTAKFTAADGFDGIGSVSITAGSYADAAGNAGAGGSDTVAVDTANPTVTSVTYGPNDGTLKAGESVTLTLNLSEAVTVAGGVPTLTLNDGGTATYVGGSGTAALTFKYTVASGENTADLSVTGFSLNGSSIKDAAANDAVLTGAVANPAGVLVVDTVIATPTVALTNDSGSSGSDLLTNDAALTVSAAAVDVTRSYSVDGGPVSATYTAPTGQGSHTVVVTDTDTAGNTANASITFNLDTVIATPTVALTNDSGSSGSDLLTN